MNILIPMTGYGSRFVNKGYNAPKPFIKVFDIPIIEWIVKRMYDCKNDNFYFIVRDNQFTQVQLNFISELANNTKLIILNDWEKKGPVVDVLKGLAEVGYLDNVIVNYCDFYVKWNYSKVVNYFVKNKLHGLIPTYTGFHPHLLKKDNVYASCKVSKNRLIDIREKYSFEENKMESYHSPGIYFFANTDVLIKYSNKLIDSNDNINGEFYTSLVYKFMIKDKLKVDIINEVKQFCQWGTPEDLEEFLFWIKYIK